MLKQEHIEDNHKLSIIPVILCGGAGRRLSPLSTDEKPKAFLNLIGGSPLIAQTYRRACALRTNAPILIGQQRHADLLNSCCYDYNLRPETVLLEPEAKNTAAAFALAAVYIMRTHGADSILALMPCDHVITPDGAFARSMTRAQQMAQRGFITTLGVKPDRADETLGYIRTGKSLGHGGFAISEFIEKPPAALAQGLITDASVLWNTGIYVAQAGTLLSIMTQIAPDLTAAVTRAFDHARTMDNALVLPAEDYAPLPVQSFDHLVMTRTTQSAACPADFLWADIGTHPGLTRAKTLLNTASACA